MRAIIVLLVLVLGGCASDQVKTVYYEDNMIGNESYGTIKGSNEKESFLYGDKTTYIIAINGIQVKGGQRAYEKTLRIKPGLNIITVEFEQGNMYGEYTFDIEVDEGSSLIAKAESSKEVITLWIEDADSKAMITDKVVVHGHIYSSDIFSEIFIPLVLGW